MLKAILILASLTATWASRGEHRVHNVILNPQKYSHCQTTRIQQVVASPGFEPISIENNICVGYCYSYSIPSTQPAEPGELIGPYCDSCQPVETKCYHVVLRSDGKDPATADTFQKRVQIINRCSCMSCETVQKQDCDVEGGTTVELPAYMFSNKSEGVRIEEDVRAPNSSQELVEEVPELMHFPAHKRPHPPVLKFDFSTTNEQRFELNSKLINLLKSIQNEGDGTNINYDKDQLKELLKIIEGSENKLSDRNLMEFVNFVNVHSSEDLELDLSLLKDVLTNFEKHQNVLERHRDFGLAQSQANNAKIEQDLKKYDLPKNFGLEETERHHHLGEPVHVGLNVGHLVKGPHGSMVLAPNLDVEEKLNIDSDVLKPNHDGVVIAYESPRNNGILTD